MPNLEMFAKFMFGILKLFLLLYYVHINKKVEI
jgi:hypothetical protein